MYFVRVLTSVSFKGKMVHGLFSVRETEGTHFYMGPLRATVIEVTQRYRLPIPLGPSRATLYTCALITYKPYRRRDSDVDDKRARKKSYSAISASWATRATFPRDAQWPKFALRKHPIAISQSSSVTTHLRTHSGDAIHFQSLQTHKLRNYKAFYVASCTPGPLL